MLRSASKEQQQWKADLIYLEWRWARCEDIDDVELALRDWGVFA